ncbi:MAG: acylphosphatase [Ignavibacteria bacterium]|nr:acylphosphatase [Ignavibacteria bacterium]
MDVTYKVILRGFVQGVGFRHFAAQKAHELGLKGWIKNLDNGDVEVIVRGGKDTVNHYIFTDLKTGPSKAQVKDMSVEEFNSPSDFPFFLVHH